MRFGFGFGFGSWIRKDSDSEKFRFVLPLVFDHSSRGKRHSRESRNKEGEFFGNGKCEFQRHNGETGSVKGETKSAIFWQRKV